MAETRFDPIPQHDKYSYVWLAIGLALSFFVTGRWTMALAVWLAPVFIMRFMRTQKAWKGFLLALPVSILTAVVSWYGLMPLPFPTNLITLVTIGVVGSLYFLIDRLLVARWQRNGRNPFATTLIYPLLVTAFEFLTVSGNPLGSFGASAYTQYGNLPLMQLASVTGMWGITFLVSWLAPVINWAWEHHFDRRAIWRGTAVYASIMAVVFIFGLGRLALSPDNAETALVAGVTAVPLDFAHLNSLDWETLRQTTTQHHDAYFAASEQLAQDGAQLILWPEGAATVAAEDEAALMARAAAFAARTGSYLAVPLVILHPNSSHYENELRIVAPSAETVLTHRKYGGHQFEVGSVPGDGMLQTAVTPLGVLSGVICWDTDFPGTVAQVGQQGVDILLSPSKDDVLLPMADLHAQMAAFRAIENGAALIRQADGGTSMVFDGYGRVLAETPYNANTAAAGAVTIMAQIPTRGVNTVYNQIGDLFGWLAVVGFVVIVGWSLVAGRKTAVTAPTVKGWSL